MITQTLNLTRKWRSKTFDTLIGQELVVKMLKNSLYTNQFFPVYLLAGQRGCGKTSTARIFAAAVNCEQLSSFQKSPKNTTIPCLACTNCLALNAGSHPDFIEIDAASYTGVDNVRMIVESSSLLPLMGRKKIYLIDEAHMLSKAAFNAFLKILEEPPLSVLFMLATTDPQKIIETVRSRCFQLFFKPVPTASLIAHLEQLCAEEKIEADTKALELIVKETGGSVRDALNVLEQVRFTTTAITRDAVQQVLGHLDDARLLLLFETVLHKTPMELLKVINEIQLETFAAEFLWQRWIMLLRASLWIKHGVKTPLFAEHTDQLRFLLRTVTASRLITMLQTFYDHELLFAKTTAAHPFFEMLLLRLCQIKVDDSSSTVPLPAAPTMPVVLEEEGDSESDEEDDDENESDEAAFPADVPLWMPGWNVFIQEIQKLEDPLLLSMFRQGKVTGINEEAKKITIQFPQDLTFLETLITDSATVCERLLLQAFGKALSIQPDFSGTHVAAAQSTVAMPTVKKVPPTPIVSSHRAAAPSWAPKKEFKPFFKKSSTTTTIKEPILDISDAQLWKTTHMVLKYFPGTVTEMRESA